MDTLAVISQAVEEGDAGETVQKVKEALAAGLPAADILDKGLVPGVQALGKLFTDGQVFLPEILIAARAMNKGLEELKPHLAGANIHKKGKIVLGTVKDDLHDIGKNLVKLMLESNGFEVIDMGIDVETEAFVSAVREHNPDILAMSALLTTTRINIPPVIEALKEAGLESKVRIMIGGAPISREFADSIGAEGFAEDCVSAVYEATRLIDTAEGGS